MLNEVRWIRETQGGGWGVWRARFKVFFFTVSGAVFNVSYPGGQDDLAWFLFV